MTHFTSHPYGNHSIKAVTSQLLSHGIDEIQIIAQRLLNLHTHQNWLHPFATPTSDLRYVR